jgi:DNA-binding NtrC family response regulator
LILGESGTGKEVLARYIHRRSGRSSGPFIAINCAAIPDNLLESELFGHEKGAFSGAAARRIGKFEAAEGGTLLLDEISEMDIRLQSKLLRVLQEREITRLGGNTTIRIDIRILASSNRDLLEYVSNGMFREDLYFRLNVVSLRFPSLRERPADIAVLSDHFARKYADANGVPYRRVSAGALRHLENNRWRGNVRELENTIHRAVLLATGDTLDCVSLNIDVAPDTTLKKQPSSAAAASEPDCETVSNQIGRRMQDIERDSILTTLQYTKGNRTHAATVLGISIRTLRNKLKDYSAQGISVPAPGAGAMA